MQTRFSQREEAPWRCSKSIRIGMAAAALLASLAGIAAKPAAAEDEVSAPDPAAAQTAAGSAEQAASPEEQVAVPEDQADGSAEPAAHRPAPPPPLATWSGAFPIGRKRYTYVMVGTNPMVKRARNTVVPVAIVPMRFVFHDGTVLDPTQPDACLGGRVPLNVTLQSPLFQDFDYGDGPRQFLEHIQRMAFWQYTGPGKLNPSYSVRLGTPTILPTQTLTLAPDSSTEDYPCATTGGTQKYGHIEGEVFDNFLLGPLTAQLPKWGLAGNTFVLVLLPFVDFRTNGVETAFAFHAYLDTSRGKITFAAAQLGLAFPDNLVNIGPMSHEFAEWLNDPFINNLTPSWEETGEEESGCSNILEVGDPLVGTFLPPIKMPNGISYQSQETAFLSWFFNQVPSIGINGWYSTGGTFKTPASPCH